MKTQRKLQLGAATVILNGLAALGGLIPQISQAQSCSEKALCGCPAVTLADCQAAAPPGCTAISVTCTPLSCGAGVKFSICQYQPS